MKWAVEIEKTSLELRNLKDLLAGIGFSVVDAASCPAITSEEMDKCLNAADVFDLAKRIQTAMRGPAGIDTKFQLGVVFDFSSDPPRRVVFAEAQLAELRITPPTGKATVGPPSGLTELELEAWKAEQAEAAYQKALEQQRARLEPAFRNENAVKVLDLLGSKVQTGESLYKIYELAEGHPKNRNAFQAQFHVTADEFHRFTDAVHNPAVTGDWARHAYHRVPRSAQPMSKREAERFVREIAARWMESVRQSG